MNDNYEHTDSCLEYVLENVLMEDCKDDEEFHTLSELFNSLLVNPCVCSVESECVVCHGENYALSNEISNSTELVLKSLDTKDLIYECSTVCPCSKDKCRNRLVQYGPRRHLKIVDSLRFKSKGVITTKDIPRGAFVCEYAGELLTRNAAQRRFACNKEQNKMNYILCLNELALGGEGNHVTIIDPSRSGNIGRYLNHSCDPNCQVFSVRVDCAIPKIAIFTNRRVAANEELCFHYGGGVKSSSQQRMHSTVCLCCSASCEQYLPCIEF